MPSRTAHPELTLDIVLKVFRLANVLGQVGNRLAGAYGLTAQQWLALTSIGVAGEAGVTPTEIGKSALVSPQNVTGLLDRLERAGYVQRAPNGEDRRSYRVRLSAEGTQVFHALNPLGAAWARQAAAELSSEEIGRFHALLDAYLASAAQAAFTDEQLRKSALPVNAARQAREERKTRPALSRKRRPRPQRLVAK